MTARALLATVLLCFSGLGWIGCAASPMAAAAPIDDGAAQGARKFVIAPVQCDGFTVDGQPEQSWLDAQKPSERAAWQDHKNRLARDLAELMYDDDAAFVAAASGQGADVVVSVQLVSYQDGVFQFVVTATDPIGRVIVGPAQVATRKGAHATMQLGYESFVVQAASMVAQLVTGAGG